MKKLFLLLLVISFTFSAKSSHIVGGDMQFIQTGPNSFTVQSRMLRYCTGTSLSTIMPINVFDANTNSLITTITNSFDSLNTFSNPTYSTCIEYHYYSGNVTLANNPNGYYATYSAGVRSSVNNIVSGNCLWTCEIPNPALIGTNSNPKFIGNPFSKEFCVGRNITLDFSAIDIDGDSLIYSLIHPFDATTGTGGAKPFSLSNYNAGYSLLSPLGPGSFYSLNRATGFLTARTTQLGIYVIAVKCEEFRNGIKIGEVIQDVQIPSFNCVLSSIKESSLNTQIKIYPNPSNGDFQIEKSSLLENVKLEVYDIYGKIILTNILTDNFSKINLEKVSKGVYLVKLSTENSQVLKRIVVR